MMDNSFGICPKCAAILVIRTAKKGINIGVRFWGCLNYPFCTYTESFSTTSISDNAMHNQIDKMYDYDYTFTKENILFLASHFNLSLSNFFYWILKEKTKYLDNQLSFHNHINNVGSPYNFTFNNLCSMINGNYDYILVKLYEKNSACIKADIEPWMKEREKERSERMEMQKKAEANERREFFIHEEYRKKKAQKATSDLFKAVKRRDVRAIVALRRKGALTNKPNEDGLTAFEYAEQLGDKEIIDALLKDFTVDEA